MARQDRARGRYFVADANGALQDCGLFMTRSGGKVDSDDNKTRPGGGEEEVALGGPKTHENITMTKLQDDAGHSSYLFLRARVGKGARAEYHEQRLDNEDFPIGAPEIHRGVHKSVEPSERDSTSGDPATFEAEMSRDGVS